MATVALRRDRSTPALPKSKDSRIELKTNQLVKETLRTAAAFSGVDLTAFIIQAASEKARRLLLESQITMLSAEEFDKVNALNQANDAPAEGLIDLMSGELFNERKE
jgi:uncharacterized protein (DUF1778 family)